MSSPAASFRRWSCSTRSRAGSPVRSAPESGEIESFSEALEGGLEFPHYTRPAEYRGWQVPDVLLSGDHGAIDAWRREQSRARAVGVRGPIDRLTAPLPQPWRSVVDWAVTIVVAVAAVLAIKA